MTTSTYDTKVADAVEADWKELAAKPSATKVDMRARNVRAVDLFKRANLVLQHPDVPLEDKRRMYQVRNDIGVQCFDMKPTYNPNYPDDFPSS